MLYGAPLLIDGPMLGTYVRAVEECESPVVAIQGELSGREGRGRKEEW